MLFEKAMTISGSKFFGSTGSRLYFRIDCVCAAKIWIHFEKLWWGSIILLVFVRTRLDYLNIADILNFEWIHKWRFCIQNWEEKGAFGLNLHNFITNTESQGRKYIVLTLAEASTYIFTSFPHRFQKIGIFKGVLIHNYVDLQYNGSC